MCSSSSEMDSFWYKSLHQHPLPPQKKKIQPVLVILTFDCSKKYICVLLLVEALPTPEPYEGEIMDMLKEYTKNRDQEQRLDAPNLEYLDK